MTEEEKWESPLPHKWLCGIVHALIAHAGMLTDRDVATGLDSNRRKVHEIYSHGFMSNVLATNSQIRKNKKLVVADTLVVKLPQLKKMKNDVDSEKQP